jgi:LemA protein
MTILIIAAIAVLILIIMSYNKLVSAVANVENAEKQIDIQIDVRFKLYENLAKVVSKALDYEKSTLAQIVGLRNKWSEATTIEEKQEIEKQVNSYGGINVVMEAYPDLKANQNTLELQRSIETAERKLGFAKQAFNDSITDYNIQKRSFPVNMIVSMFPSVNKTFAMWELEAEDKKKKEESSINI